MTSRPEREARNGFFTTGVVGNHLTSFMVDPISEIINQIDKS